MFERLRFRPEHEPRKDDDDNPQPSSSSDVDLSGNFVERKRDPSDDAGSDTPISQYDQTDEQIENPDLTWTDEDEVLFDEVQKLRSEQAQEIKEDADVLDDKFK